MAYSDSNPKYLSPMESTAFDVTLSERIHYMMPKVNLEIEA